MMEDDDMDEEILHVTGRGKAAAGKKRRKQASDDEEPAGSKRGKHAAGDSEDDDMDEDERQKLENMNELEREMYLYEREEQLQRARLGKAVLDQTRNRDAEQVEVRASSRRPRAQTGTDSAIGKIAAAHAQREAREKKKQQEQEERQEKQQRARSRKRQADEQEQELQLPDDEEEAVATDEEEEASDEDEASDDEDALAGLEQEDEDEGVGAAGKQLGARAEVYDEGAGYEEAEENATLEEIHSIQLKRSQLEAWHSEPFFEADLPGCVLRIVPNLGPNAPRSGTVQYMLARVEHIVLRNSYVFPKAPERTRKWLHLDDLTGNVFRHQMMMVSNSPITQEEYEKAKAKAAKAGAKFITKGDVQQALDKLQHARSFKYDQQLVKEMLQKKRATGKMTGGYAQTRARLNHELILAQQEGRSEDEIQRVRDELDRLEQQQRARVEEEEELLAAAVEAEKQKQPTLAPRAKGSLGLALVNMRNRDKNAFKTINAPAGSAMAKATAASNEGGNTADVFSRRHTQSKVYWATGRSNTAATAAAKQAAEQQLQRTASGAAEVELLKGNMKKMDPAELIKVLDLHVDLSSLPREPLDLVSKRVLGMRWYQTAHKRQQEIVAGRHLISLPEWRQRCEQTRAL